jgi:hypothetical protein
MQYNEGMFALSSLFIAFLTACLPFIVRSIPAVLPKLTLRPAPFWLPLAAGFLFIVAFLIPDIHISHETSTFQQHFVGGGIYCTLLYFYFQKLFGWKTNWAFGFMLLIAWTSTFGVANELLEFTLTKTHLAHIGTGDTDWDLLANTMGSILSYLVLVKFLNNQS